VGNEGLLCDFGYVFGRSKFGFITSSEFLADELAQFGLIKSLEDWFEVLFVNIRDVSASTGIFVEISRSSTDEFYFVRALNRGKSVTGITGSDERIGALRRGLII